MEVGYFITPSDLDKMIKEITATIKKEIEKLRTQNSDPPMNGKQAADYLGIHVNTFYKRFKEGTYPTKLMHGDTKNKFFFASELEAYLKKS